MLRATLSICVLCLAMPDAASAQRQANPTYEPASPDPLAALPNLFRNARVADASPHWSDRAPAFAIDGQCGAPGAHWAAENIPVHLTLDLGRSARLNAILLHTYWDGTRYYQYVIEASADGKTWRPLVDRRDNTQPATERGEWLEFPAVEAQFVRITFIGNSAGDRAGGHVVEIAGFEMPEHLQDVRALREAAWVAVPPGLHAAVGSLDVRYARDDVPDVSHAARTWKGVAWRGERVHAQLVVWSADALPQLRLTHAALRTTAGDEIDGEAIRPRFVRYVLGDGQLSADIIDDAHRIDTPARQTRPIWVSIDVPPDAAPGVYRGAVTATAAGGLSATIPLELEVLPLTLPPPKEWSFHLDLWQNPYAVARYHHVRPWSTEHYRLLEPHLRMLADAGQKCLTTTIVHRPWGTQTFDPYDSMVQWIRRADGAWRFDYAVFDGYVEFAEVCGFAGQINCYSMVPWTNRVRYLDEATGDWVDVDAPAGSEKFVELWSAFLPAFRDHLRERGWLERVTIAMDERPLPLMKPTIELVRRVAPELKITLAGKNEPELRDDVYDWCVYVSPPLAEEHLKVRAARGDPTTFYVCCNPPKPNTFTWSPPAESAWIGWHAAARGYSGFLRWAYDSWTEDPLRDAQHVTWSSGDCFLVYPNARSSIRFERLREGIQDFEKIRVLRAHPALRDSAELAALDAALAEITFDAAQNTPAAEFVNRGQTALLAAARAAANGEHRRPAGM